MWKKCTRPECPAPKGLCLEHVSPDYQKCKHWLGSEDEKAEKKSKPTHRKIQSLPWTGESFQPQDLDIISHRSAPLIIGMIGTADAGKTSYLGMLYTLLFNGKTFQHWRFAGSYTLAAWEMLAQYLKIQPDGKVRFAPPTPSNPDFYSLYHLALKRGELFRDVLFADSSGEVFNLWSENIHDENAGNARWVYEKSNAFIFMVDSVSLIERRGAAKSQIIQMAEQVAANLKSRPLVVTWSKADEINNVPDTIKRALDEDLNRIFEDSGSFEISNFSKSDPDTLCHKNNIAVTEYLLENLNEPKEIKLIPQVDAPGDIFLDYGGVLGVE